MITDHRSESEAASDLRVLMSEESSVRHSISDCPHPRVPRAVQVYTHCTRVHRLPGNVYRHDTKSKCFFSTRHPNESVCFSHACCVLLKTFQPNPRVIGSEESFN